MTILSLDLGTTTGWATKAGSTIVHGTASFSNSRYDGGGMRYLKFRKWLDMQLDHLMPPLVVCYEEVRGHKGTDAAHVYGGLLATLTSWCEERSIPYEGIPVGTWKKALCGKGNASKETVLKEVNGRGHAVESFDESDAVAILLFVLERDNVRH